LALKSHEGSNIPELIIPEIINHLKNNDTISVKESIKEQMNIIRDIWPVLYGDAVENYSKLPNSSKIYSTLKENFIPLDDYCENLIAIGLVIIDYGDKNNF